MRSLHILLLFLILSLTACALGVRQEHDPDTNINAKVITLPNNKDVIALSADNVVTLMRRAGFSDQQILDLGTDLRNALATEGAAQVQVKDKVEAIFAVSGSQVHVSSYQRGSFIFHAETSEIR